MQRIRGAENPAPHYHQSAEADCEVIVYAVAWNAGCWM